MTIALERPVMVTRFVHACALPPLARQAPQSRPRAVPDDRSAFQNPVPSFCSRKRGCFFFCELVRICVIISCPPLRISAGSLVAIRPLRSSSAKAFCIVFGIHARLSGQLPDTGKLITRRVGARYDLQLDAFQQLCVYGSVRVQVPCHFIIPFFQKRLRKWGGQSACG